MKRVPPIHVNGRSIYIRIYTCVNLSPPYSCQWMVEIYTYMYIYVRQSDLITIDIFDVEIKFSWLVVLDKKHTNNVMGCVSLRSSSLY